MDRQRQEQLSKKFADMKIDERIDLLLMFYADSKYNSRRTAEQKEIIDHLFNDGYYPLWIDEPNQEHIDPELRKGKNERDYKSETLQMMVDEKLVKTFMDVGCMAYEPTAFGHRVNERGGWKKQVRRDNIDRRALTISSISAIAAAVTTFVIISVTCAIAYQDLGIHKQELNIQQTIYTQDSLQKIQHHKSATQTQFLADSLQILRNEMDTLNSKVSTLQKKVNGL